MGEKSRRIRRFSRICRAAVARFYGVRIRKSLTSEARRFDHLRDMFAARHRNGPGHWHASMWRCRRTLAREEFRDAANVDALRLSAPVDMQLVLQRARTDD